MSCSGTAHFALLGILCETIIQTYFQEYGMCVELAAALNIKLENVLYTWGNAQSLLFSQDTQCCEYFLQVVRHPKGGKLTFNNLKMSNFPWVSPTPSWGKPLIAIGALQKNKNNKKGGLPFSFHQKKTTEGKFQLQMTLWEGTGARFKTSLFLIGKSYCY